MSQEKIKQLKFEIEKEKEYIDSLTENLSQRNEQVIAKELELEELMSAGRFRPDNSNDYWFIESNGRIGVTYFQDKFQSDEGRYNIGNCFPTEESAIKRRDFMQFLTDNNLWDKLDERVRLQVELEAFAKEALSGDFISKGFQESINTFLAVYNAKGELTASEKGIVEKFGTRLNLLFEPLS